MPEIPTGGENLRYVASGSRGALNPPISWSVGFLKEVWTAMSQDAQYQEGLMALDSEDGGKDNLF